MARRRRTAKADLDWMAYRRAMNARKSVLHVIVKIIKKDKTGVYKTSFRTGSSFVIKVDLQAQQTFLLTSAHVLCGRLNPGDGLRVRMMLSGGVEQYPASIVHKSRSMDVAILRVPGLTAATPLRFSPEDSNIGESIAAVGYCDPLNLFAGLSFSKIPAINPGRVRGTLRNYSSGRIRLYQTLLSCVGVEGMSGGPVISKRGVVGMTDTAVVDCTYAVHPNTILAVLKKCVGVEPQVNMAMEEVIDRIA